MALIVTCKDLTEAIEVLHRIAEAMDARRIPGWERIGSSQFRSTKEGLKDEACFRPTIKENRICFGLVNPAKAPYTVSSELYDDYHALFYELLVRLSWRFFFTVEYSEGRLADIDART